MIPPKLPKLNPAIYSAPSTLLLVLGVFAIATVLLTSEQPYFVQDAEASVAEENAEIACANSTHDLTTIQSEFDVPESVARLQLGIQQQGLNVLAVIDHASAVSGVASEGDAPLRPTTLILFGAPAVGASLLQSEQSIGIDLPLKYLVWQNACDQVYIGYDEINALQRRHKISQQDDVFAEIADLLNSIALTSAVSLE